MSVTGGFVAVLVIDVHFPDAGSLKGKRKELSSLKAQLRQRLGAAVAETGHQDLWQRSTLTAVLVSETLPVLTTAVERVERWLEERLPQGVGIERLVVSVEDLRG
ncbi:MAG TPA: DUF503 domain-containing protein [Conexibacter sp.]|nr:DUF503 domain-containing protein [Conexibacter sp.]